MKNNLISCYYKKGFSFRFSIASILKEGIRETIYVFTGMMPHMGMMGHHMPMMPMMMPPGNPMMSMKMPPPHLMHPHVNTATTTVKC